MTQLMFVASAPAKFSEFLMFADIEGLGWLADNSWNYRGIVFSADGNSLRVELKKAPPPSTTNLLGGLVSEYKKYVETWPNAEYSPVKVLYVSIK